MAQTIYLVAGEHSGDTRGVELMESLRAEWPDCQFSGLGGRKMRAFSGGGVADWVDEAAVVGLWEVLKKYGWFKARFEETKREIAQIDPDVVILVDYPGFNLRLAKALHSSGTRAKLVDYVSPQVWAWNKGRVVPMAEYLDLMLCLFPFEVELFESAGLKTVCMGHPLVDQPNAVRIEGGREEGLIGLFPGSREREVARLFPVMLDAVRTLSAKYPDWKFSAAAASGSLLGMMQEMRSERGISEELLALREGGSHELMQRVTAGVVASGTATLEATFYGMPYCLVYKVAWPTYLAGRLLVNIEHIGLANILAKRPLVPEFLQSEASGENVASFLESVMTEPRRRATMELELLETAGKLGGGGAAERAAQAIVALFDED
jgi:lipid-A-disaccharide synthase